MYFTYIRKSTEGRVLIIGVSTPIELLQLTANKRTIGVCMRYKTHFRMGYENQATVKDLLARNNTLSL